MFRGSTVVHYRILVSPPDLFDLRPLYKGLLDLLIFNPYLLSHSLQLQQLLPVGLTQTLITEEAIWVQVMLVGGRAEERVWFLDDVDTPLEAVQVKVSPWLPVVLVTDAT